MTNKELLELLTGSQLSLEEENQKALSYKQLTPSKDFNGDKYSLYLEYASAIELERDVVSVETYRKIYTNLPQVLGKIEEDILELAETLSSRHPQTPSLKEQALKALAKIEDNEATYLDASVVRQALVALPLER